VRRAAADGARLVLLPEKWSVLGKGADLRAGAEPLDGPAIAWARDTAQELGKKLGAAADHMQKADDRMKGKDPSGAREATKAAAEELAKARDRARSAARQAQQNTVGDEPIRIPGADEYRAPTRFREDLLEGMKKREGTKSLDGYDDMLKRYVEDLTK